MLKIFYKLPNGESFAHVSRSCTSTLCALSLATFWPDQYRQWQEYGGPPQQYLEEHYADRLPSGCVCMIRNPLKRLVSYVNARGHDWDEVRQILNAMRFGGVISRNVGEAYSLRRFHHLLPITLIAEPDTQFIKFAGVEKACEVLGLTYDPTVHVAASGEDYCGCDTPDDLKVLLTDDIQLWRSLT